MIAGAGVGVMPPTNKIIFYLPEGWTTLYQHQGEQRISERLTFTTLEHLAKEYKVSLEYQPTSLGPTDQILEVGNNRPGIWMVSGNTLRFHFGLDGSTAKRDFSDFPPLRKWTKLEIKQVKEGSTYYVTISMDSKIISREINSKPKDEYNLVTISQHPGLIKSILIQHKND